MAGIIIGQHGRNVVWVRNYDIERVMGKHDKVYSGKYKGKWAVFVNGCPVFADLSKSQLAYHIKKANENINLYGWWLDKSK